MNHRELASIQVWADSWERASVCAAASCASRYHNGSQPSGLLPPRDPVCSLSCLPVARVTTGGRTESPVLAGDQGVGNLHPTPGLTHSENAGLASSGDPDAATTTGCGLGVRQVSERSKAQEGLRPSTRGPPRRARAWRHRAKAGRAARSTRSAWPGCACSLRATIGPGGARPTR